MPCLAYFAIAALSFLIGAGSAPAPAQTPARADAGTEKRSDPGVVTGGAPGVPGRTPDRVWSTQPSPVPAYISGGAAGGSAVIVAPMVLPPGAARLPTPPTPLPGRGTEGAPAGPDRPAGAPRPERGS